MPQDNHHVVPDPEGGWNIKRSGGQRASHHFDRKEDAVNKARNISGNQGTELFIHKKDGTIQRKDSHGRDKFPPRG